MSEVDVLIVGAGPAGLMLAMWLSKLKISSRIIDKSSTEVMVGRADGVQCRTVEVFQSFGIAERFINESSHINEIVFWNPSDVKGEEGIVRTKRTPDNAPGTSRFPHGVLTQARIERFMLDAIKDFNELEVERLIEPVDMVVDSNPDLSHPITITIRHLAPPETDESNSTTSTSSSKIVPNGLYRSNILSEEESQLINKKKVVGEEEVLKAKYVVGCDGARSWVRNHIGLKLEPLAGGDSANVYWGVIDVAVITNFPDIRLKCTIHSKNSGSILVIPREKGLVRFYVQMGTTLVGERVDRSAITHKSILDRARQIFYPYTLECPHIDWWTVYEVGQRLSPKVTLDERIFIAGDAFHTHSPKAGQGMNISMMDTYNLGWKLAGVIKGNIDSKILSTYQNERHQTAKELIELDYKLASMFASKPIEKVGDEGVSLTEFKEFFIKAGAWASGTAVCYQPSELIASNNLNISGLPIGMRLKSYQAVCLADAKPWHIGDMLISDGRFRIIIFAGDLRISTQRERLENLAMYLNSKGGPIRKYTKKDSDIDSVIEIITIISNPRISSEPTGFPDILFPTKSPYNCRDYNKIFSDDDSWFSGHGKAYESLGIDEQVGCVVIVRPDQYVASTSTLDDHTNIGDYFNQFMIQVKNE